MSNLYFIHINYQKKKKKRKEKKEKEKVLRIRKQTYQIVYVLKKVASI